MDKGYGEQRTSRTTEVLSVVHDPAAVHVFMGIVGCFSATSLPIW